MIRSPFAAALILLAAPGAALAQSQADSPFVGRWGIIQEGGCDGVQLNLSADGQVTAHNDAGQGSLGRWAAMPGDAGVMMELPTDTGVLQVSYGASGDDRLVAGNTSGAGAEAAADTIGDLIRCN